MNFDQLKSHLEGDLFIDNVQRVLYSSDASQYKEMPVAVTKPKNKEDIKKIIQFARENKTSVIPSGAGTSLAGQVVGTGIVVDISKYMNKILEFNQEENYVIVEPGVVLAEFLQHYYDIHGIPLRARLIAYLPRLNKLAMVIRPISNFIMDTALLKKIIGFSTKRTVPPLSKITLKCWIGNGIPKPEIKSKGKIYLFNDEFTNYNESDIGIKAILLLTKLGYEVRIPVHKESGRTFLLKGLLRSAKKIATENINLLKDIILAETPLVGIEPSAILAFHDEYPELVEKNLQSAADKLAKNALLFEEFISAEIEKGKILESDFTTEEKHILLHGHCQQKAVASTESSKNMLSLPKNYFVKEIPSGCCGMAGSFGYEKEHYELSMQIGEMVLFPAVREAKVDYIISAPGTSCRHQIKDGTGKTALHPVEVLYEALIK